MHLFDGADLEDIYYFTAVPEYKLSSYPDTVKRHLDYLDALKSFSINIVFGRFIEKPRIFWHQGQKIVHKRHEEKLTDVAIASKLIYLFVKDMCDKAVIISGDADIIPAIQTAKELKPNKDIYIMFPHRRTNDFLKK